MGKQKVYYWRGPGELLGCKPGEKVPVSKMGKKQLAKMIEDGRIQETAFGIDEGTSVVEELKANVKILSEKIVELNKRPGCDDYECEDCKESSDKIADLEKQADDDAVKIADLEKQVEELTKPKDK